MQRSKHRGILKLAGAAPLIFPRFGKSERPGFQALEKSAQLVAPIFESPKPAVKKQQQQQKKKVKTL